MPQMLNGVVVDTSYNRDGENLRVDIILLIDFYYDSKRN